MGRADDRTDAAAGEGGTIRVEVVYAAAPHDVDLSELRLAPGATVAEALQASGLMPRRGLDAASAEVGVWGARCPRDHRLRDGDRVEVYRPLQVDPKEARRRRDARAAATPGRRR